MAIFTDSYGLKMGWAFTFILGGSFVLFSTIFAVGDRMEFDFVVSEGAIIEYALRSADPVVLDHATGQALTWNRSLVSKIVCNTKWYCDVFVTDKWDAVEAIEL